MLGLNAFAENAFASIGQGFYVLGTGNKITVANNGAGVQVLAGAVAAVTGEKIVVSQNAAGVVVKFLIDLSLYLINLSRPLVIGIIVYLLLRTFL